MKKISVFLLSMLLPVASFAVDGATLDLNVRRIGLEWSKTDVKNANKYEDSPISALNENDTLKLVVITPYASFDSVQAGTTGLFIPGILLS